MVNFYFGVVYIYQFDNSRRYPLLRTLQLPKTGCLSQKFATRSGVFRLKTEYSEPDRKHIEESFIFLVVPFA